MGWHGRSCNNFTGSDEWNIDSAIPPLTPVMCPEVLISYNARTDLTTSNGLRNSSRQLKSLSRKQNLFASQKAN
jgi:hypothetical protein